MSVKLRDIVEGEERFIILNVYTGVYDLNNEVDFYSINILSEPLEAGRRVRNAVEYLQEIASWYKKEIKTIPEFFEALAMSITTFRPHEIHGYHPKTRYGQLSDVLTTQQSNCPSTRIQH